MTRHLPKDTDLLSTDDILQVWLGWSASDEAWHLGLVLREELATERGSRWCELVSWPDHDRTVFADEAQECGEHLAQVMGMSLYVASAVDLDEIDEARALPALPIAVDLWTISAPTEEKDRFEIRRDPRWMHAKVRQVLWYGFWAVVYTLVSVATLTSEIAMPNSGITLRWIRMDPNWLPYLGLGSAVFLVGLMAYHTLLITRRPDRIVVDAAAGSISGWRLQQCRWHVDKQSVRSLFVTEMVKHNQPVPNFEYGEINLHLGNGKFQHLFAVGQMDGQQRIDLTDLQRRDHDEPPLLSDDYAVQDEDAGPSEYADHPLPLDASQVRIQRRKDRLVELTRAYAHTDLQAIGLYIAEALEDLPAWHDQRVKAL